MTHEGEHHETQAIVTWTGLISVVTLVAVILGGIIAYVAADAAKAREVAHDAREIARSARPDPFTGTMGREMENKLIARDMAVLEAMRRECKLTSEKIDARFLAVERDVEQCHQLMNHTHYGYFKPGSQAP